MKAGDLVKDKKTGSVGIIANAWIDENDKTSVIVEFLEKKDIAVYWSPGMFHDTPGDDQNHDGNLYHTDILELLDDDD